MVRPDGYVKVLDFGLAKLSDPAMDVDADTALRTMPGTILGTPRYMSPEQIRGIGVDQRTDIWSLGVMLSEMLDGRPPFAGPTAADVASAILTSERLLERFTSGVHAGFGHVLFKALRKNPLERYSDAQELVADLDAAYRPGGESPPRIAPAAASSTRSNFPLPLTPFVGREDDLAALGTAVASTRFVTLTGAGGVGKTRLALRAAADCVGQFADGVWLVDLAPLSDATRVPSAVADVLKVRDHPDRGEIIQVVLGWFEELKARVPTR